MELIEQACRYFKPDTPCSFHKRRGTVCRTCRSFRPVRDEILIIKREALGDVLRTTSLLQPLKKAYPDSRLVWLCAPSARDVLAGNPLIDEIWTDDFWTTTAASLVHWNALYNFDLSFESLVVAASVSAERKYGFRFDERRRIICSNDAAEEWFFISHDDRAKKANRNTYQEFLRRICGFDRIGDIIVPLNGEAIREAASLFRTHRITGRCVGLNVGSGDRWVTKRWPVASWLALAERLGRKHPVALLGGEGEREEIAWLKKRSAVPLFDCSTPGSLPLFFAVVARCSLVVTGDTLALHAALGLGRKVVALFGPTSAAEIEQYGNGASLVTPFACSCCYRRRCSRHPSCMKAISPVSVARAAERLLARR